MTCIGSDLSSSKDPLSGSGPGKGKVGKPKDGRANNKPPQSYQIKKGEVRNPHGRGGKPSSAVSSRVEELHIAEASRIVSSDSDGPVDALIRIVQEEWHSALFKGDEKARIRVLAVMESALARKAAEQKEMLEWVWAEKARYTELFATARKLKQPPPDVVHPDHVTVENDQIVLTGPIDPEARKHWEFYKAVIKLAECMHGIARSRAKRDPSLENRDELKRIEARRRQLMRAVPKSWNWREDIYCLHSETEAVNEAIRTTQGWFDANA